MNSIEQILAIEAIKQLKARYFRAMDTKDWETFAAVFADNARMDMSAEMYDGRDPEAGIISGGQAIADFVRSSIDKVETVHHGHMPEIQLTSATTADGIWAMEDLLRWPEGASPRSLHGFGHYHETYAKIGDEWKIRSIRLSRLRLDIVY